MKSKTMKMTLVAAVLLVSTVFLAGCSGTTQEPGMLTGKVTIGPISPVEIPGENLIIPCEVYEARKIMVYDERRNKLIAQVDIDCSDGMYRTELSPGTYTVDINRIGIDHSAEVPAKVQIRPGETVRLDIDIDTGIR